MSTAQTAMSWVNYFTMQDFIQNRLPGYKEKQILDNWTIIIGANDRSNLMGPNLSVNIGANYSTSYDLLGFLMNNYLKAGTYSKLAGKLILGSGDIKMAFGPSTSLLYGGPGGSSKRGPYWDRIAGTWSEPRAKGAKYSAEGSFSPQAVGKGAGDGLQFFERDQIFGEGVNDGHTLGIMTSTGRKLDKEGKKEEFFGDTKNEKYKSDLEKCYTESEMTVLEAGDKAAKRGTIVLALLDLACNLLAVLLVKKIDSAAVFTSLDNLAKEKRDLDYTKSIMIGRLAYKTVKILALQIMETLENTERLARQLQENVAGGENQLKRYYQNKHFAEDKRKALVDMEVRIIEENEKKKLQEEGKNAKQNVEAIKEVFEESKSQSPREISLKSN